MVAILQERKEKEAKKKALQEERAAKLKKIEEEMAREKERLKKEEEERLKEMEEEEKNETPLQRRNGQYSGSKDEEMEKRILEWVANLSLGEQEEVTMYIPKDEQEAAMKKWEAEEDVLKRQAMEDETRMVWKLAMMREKKRRVEAASAAMQELAKAQLVGLFYRAMPEAFQGQFFAKSKDPATTYDSLSLEVVAFEAKSVSLSTFWHKDLDKGKQWKGRTISGQVKTKDNLVLTLDEGRVEEIPYEQIEWGLEEEDSNVSQGRTYAAVAAGGRPQGGGRGQGQGGRASGSRFHGDQGVGSRGGNRHAGGRGQGPPQNHPRNRSPYRVLEKLREANFKINAKKCDWAKTQVLYLGHVLDGDRVKPEDCKIAAIRDWPTPRTLAELRSFLGLANYCRKFVRNFSTIAAPLRRPLRKETIWKWDKDCTSAVKKLKQALIEYPVLKVADPSLPFVVTTDASQYDIGALLQQDDGNGYRNVEFMSARMPSEKVATSTYERELYALRQALEHWKHYLLGRHFKVYSDHETLRWLKTQAKMTPKLTRWAAEIDQYDFELKPVKGKYNIVADALSRRADYFGAIVHYLDIGSDLQQKVKEAYAQDPIYSELLRRS
ncbi:hypothetical protein CBR_g3379 [Chara braunii]|uniref:Reverse transcriptase RNase H-like domain-containing protein n=1 Tax=Chara braunii TaxID=69332 RepID=A0A388JQP0_CHABU|nr:hypothetical protein CBR_g3379 [Chara braunii]|eukprot:GBG60136.1 hypothetical protein CBR_g3379 [Chara braunii]